MNRIIKEDADYVAYSDTQHCEDCSMFKEPDRCTLVTGEIARKGHCKFWEKKNWLVK